MFVVTKKFGRAETRVKDFTKESEASTFIMEKLREDIRFKIMATYCLYEGADLIREYAQSDVVTESPSTTEDASESGQQKGSGQSFRPSPFATTPRVGPQSWVKNDNEGQDKDKDDKK